jgi:hypothetical protein
MTQAYTNRFTEVHEPAAVLVPDSYAVGAHATGYVSMANRQRAVFVLGVGEMQATSTVDCQLWQATTALGANAKIVAGKAITQLTQAAGDGNDLLAIELRTEELDVDGGFSFVGGIVTVGAAASELSAVLLLGCTNYAPVPVTAWTEIVD